VAANPHFSPGFYCGGVSWHVYFHEKVGDVKYYAQWFLKTARLGGLTVFAPTSAMPFFAFVIPRPFTSLLSRF
jgi:hypothetical protein